MINLMDFVQSIIVAILGTFFGATGAFMLERLLRRSEAKSKEVFALNVLIVDLHLRRALAIAAPAKVTEEIFNNIGKYATQSVLDIRQLINQTRIQIRQKSNNFETLVRMSADCNRFLENTQLAHLDYQFELVTLAKAFDQNIIQLSSTPRVTYRSPGSNAL